MRRCCSASADVRVLYLSWTGLAEPLGRSQVLAYLRRLAGTHAITLVTLEKAADLADGSAFATLLAECRAAGIDWRPRRYRGGAVGALRNLLGLWWEARGVLRGAAFDLVHARSYLPALVAWWLRRGGGPPYLFDMRALWIDERIGAGRLPARGWRLGLLRRMESALLRDAAAVVSLTHAAVAHLRALPGLAAQHFAVIPTCVELERFVPRVQAPGEGGFVLGSVGTVASGWYRMPWLFAFFAALRRARPEARLVLVTRDPPGPIRHAAAQAGIDPAWLNVASRPPDLVAGEMAAMDAGALFFTPGIAKLGSSPTRMGEFLASGLPCVANAGVGDVAGLIARERIGVVVASEDPDAMDAAARELLVLCADPELPARCRAAAEAHFSVDAGVATYDALYRRVANPTGPDA
jgi:glycosyltransferase involved in cell wall biosynthesis